MSELRLLDVAEAYSAQLHGHTRGTEVKFRLAFKDTYSPYVYKAIHALFWELAVLRDALAHFLAEFLLRRGGIKTMAGLLKSLRKEPFADDEICQLEIVAKSGWLKKFGAYRDCFTHSAPLDYIDGFAWAVQDLLPLRDGRALPQLYYALPSNIEELVRLRANGFQFASPQEMAQRSSRWRDRAVDPDALTYLHSCLCLFADLSWKFGRRSPIAPKSIVIKPDDLQAFEGSVEPNDQIRRG